MRCFVLVVILEITFVSETLKREERKETEEYAKRKREKRAIQGYST